MDKSANAIRVMSYNEDELEQLTTFLREIDDIFPIPLSKKVSIDEYALRRCQKESHSAQRTLVRCLGSFLAMRMISATRMPIWGHWGF